MSTLGSAAVGVCVYISLQDLELRPVRFDVDVPPGAIEYDNKVVQSTVLHAEGVAELMNHALGEMRLTGKLSVSMEAPCDRCLEKAMVAVEQSFDLVYMPAEEVAAGGEDEIEEASAEVGFYEGNGLELNDVLREVVLLAMPMRLVCDEACKGICPVCGQDRNQRACGCSIAKADDRWNELKKIMAEIGPRN